MVMMTPAPLKIDISDASMIFIARKLKRVPNAYKSAALSRNGQNDNGGR